MTFSTTRFHHIRHAAFAVTVGGSIAVSSLASLGQADARVPDGDRMSLSSVACGSLQDDFDTAHANYITAASAEARAAAATQMSHAIDSWYDTGCDQWYGGISFIPYTPADGLDLAPMPTSVSHDAGVKSTKAITTGAASGARSATATR